MNRLIVGLLIGVAVFTVSDVVARSGTLNGQPDVASKSDELGSGSKNGAESDGGTKTGAGKQGDAAVVTQKEETKPQVTLNTDDEVKRLKTLVAEQDKKLEDQQRTADDQKRAMETMGQQINVLIKQDFETRRLVNSDARTSSDGGILMSTGGTHYVRWGRKDCPYGVLTLYEGFVGGTYFNHQFGGTNALCLHESPQWGTTGQNNQGQSIYGAEYYFSPSAPFSTENNGGQELVSHDVPCAVCHTPLRSSQIMIPGRQQCPTGWTFEYTGYIVSNYFKSGSSYFGRSDYLCLDDAPGSVIGGQDAYNGLLLYPVQTVCGSLPCPPYVASRNLVCVVCTM